MVDDETGGTRVNADIARAVPSGRRADDRLCCLSRVGPPVSQATIDLLSTSCSNHERKQVGSRAPIRVAHMGAGPVALLFDWSWAGEKST